MKALYGYNFNSWTGDASGINNSINFVMDGDKTVNAIFNRTGSVYQEDFNDGNANGFICTADVIYQHYSVANNQYVMTGKNVVQKVPSYYSGNTYTDFTISVDLKQTSGNELGYGLYFRSTDGTLDSNGNLSYALAITSNGYWYLKVYDFEGVSSYVKNVTYSSAINQGMNV